MDTAPAPTATAATAFRPEIQALRAIAVMAVVIYHLWPGRLPGGYVGVDIFFVISGFLITAHLVKEAERSGRIRLGSFYARRARRLLPAALIVTLATAIGTVLVLPVQNWPQISRELVAATFYVENWVLAADSVDYLAQNANIASPVQHYWSLSVEEQFYLVWPLLVIGSLVLVARVRRGLPLRRVLAVVFALVVTASLVHSIVLTAVDPGPAYFATTTRAWEFGAGGLLALTTVGRRPTPIVRRGLSILGLVLIAATLLTFTEATPFPGSAALLPVVGTLLVIVAGTAEGPLGTAGVFRLRPVQWLGAVSYSLYLWHWPVIVLTAAAVEAELGTVTRVALLLVSLVLGWLTKVLVEDPARAWRLLADARPRRTLAAVALALVPVLGVSLVVGGVATARIDAERDRVEAAASGDLDCFGAAALIEDGCSTAAVTGDLIPSVIAAPSDDVNTPECWSRSNESQLKVCSFGPDADAADVSIALVGDSHSNQYLAAVQQLADDRGWAVDVIGKTGCIWTEATQVNDVTWLASCDEWKTSLDDYLVGSSYDAIVTSASAESPIDAAGGDVESTTVDGFVDAWTPVAAGGTAIVVIRDNPHTREDYLECIDDDPATAADRCAVPLEDAFPFFDGLSDAASATPGASVVDFTPYFCIDDRCPPVIGGSIVYRDPGHLTSTYTRSLSPLLGDAIEAAIG
ncbi:acyltransferase family protein [Labedella endophytica]|uniref:acyltransferase family protein n=1 Tax=Labedella endophytica TaxID=1523160 RepID=UPI0014085A48|nr:acyltransferase family protein [Labedella endophytica]